MILRTSMVSYTYHCTVALRHMLLHGNVSIAQVMMAMFTLYVTINENGNQNTDCPDSQLHM